MRRKKKNLEHGPDSLTLVVNREYDELEKNRKLARVLKLRSERLKLVAEWQAVWAEMNRCSNQVWIDKFAMRMLRKRKKVYENLQRHFDHLESHRRRLVVRIRKIFEEIVNLGGSVMTPMEPAAGEVSDVSPIPYERGLGRIGGTAAQFRDQVIRRYRNLSNEQLCQRLDFELSVADPPLGFPENWLTKYGVKTYSDAYKNSKCRGLVQKLIAKAKHEP